MSSENAELEADRRWRALVAHWPGYLLTVDAENRLTSLSRSTRLIDATRDLGRDLFDFVVPDEQVELRADLAAVRAGGTTGTRRARTHLSDGTWRWYDSRCVLLDDAGVMLVTNDVTVEEETKLALQRSEQRHRALVENSHDAISLTAADGTTLYVSPAVEKISGYTPADFVGGKPFENVHPDDRDRVSTAFARIRTTPSEHVTFEYRARHRDGAYRWIEATGTNLLGDPSVAAIVANFRDVTASRELAEERRRAGDAQRSRERLRVLTKVTMAFSKTSGSPERLFETLVHELAETLHCACALNLITNDGAHFTTAHAHASDPDLLSAFLAHLTAGSPRRVAAYPGMRHVVETRTPFFVPVLDANSDEISTGTAPDLLQFMHEMPVTSALVVPLSVQGRVIGALSLIRHGEQAPALDEQDLALAQTLAEHAALALAAARLLEESEGQIADRDRMAVRLRLLTEASREFSEATSDSDRLLAVIARHLSEIIGDLCAIRAVSEDGTMLEIGAAHHRDPEITALAQSLLATHPQRVGEGAMGRVVASGEPIFVPSSSAAEFAASTSPQYREILERLNV